MKIYNIKPLAVEERKESVVKPTLLITSVLTLSILALWHFWPVILVNSIHWQKVSLDYLTDQFYSGDMHSKFVIVGVCFLYGVLHALGPGHGKVVVSTYLATSNTKLKAGILITICAAIMQAIVAIVLVSTFLFVLQKTMHKLNATVSDFAVYSGCVVGVLGLQLMYKAIKLFYIAHSTKHITQANGQCSCGHNHSPDPEELSSASNFKEYFMIVLSIGLRPCSGAILVLFFAHLTHVFWVGVIGTFLMSIGTAITTSTVAFLTVSGRKIIQIYSNFSFQVNIIIPIFIKCFAGLFFIMIALVLIFTPSYGLSPILS
ncbi:nickel/cobalt transporter [Vibrio artabrorum]|uniref:Nickel/cobalt efflux system n=1 Tax=Vibrio artabrorum TaxID=446374 RepID=A0ABT8CF76_9VIBR|nr:nickel/cobalt transporter [Vibrio artabrorum]MDN3700128.1 nickel/cobalt transporter [Vibrio artabrorum]